MDKKKLQKLVSAIMVGNNDEIGHLVAECMQNYSAERREDLYARINKEMSEARNGK
jgi:hypothetical protein